LSATHEALAAVRVMANTIGMGEAAGCAAALSLREHEVPRRLDPRKVQQLLIDNDGWLGEDFALVPKRFAGVLAAAR
jgi:hypothetical protein